MSFYLGFAFRCAIAVLPCVAGIAWAQNYPSKPIRIVTSAPGGGSDVVSRLVAQSLTASLGQQVVVENRGGGVIAGEIIASSPPDGYNLLYYGSTFWLLPLLRKDVPYDPVRDFAPISWISRQPNVLVVHPALPVKSVADLIALAKARPGALNYSSGGTGSSGHLAAELFKFMAHVNIVRINYKGQGPATTDAMAGQVQLTFGTTTSVASFVRAGKLRALAVTSAEPSALFPKLPTIASSGLPGYESEQMSGLFAPAKTPAAIIGLLNRAITQALAKPDIRERAFNSGSEVIGSSPEIFAGKIKAEIARIGKLIQETGIHDD